MDFIIIPIHHSSPFCLVAAQSICNVCILKVKVIVLKRQLLRALRKIPLHSSFPELVELSGPSSSSSSAEERRLYARLSNEEETMLLRLWAENFDRRFFKLCKVSSLTYFFHLVRLWTLVVESKSLLSGCGFKFSVVSLPAKLKTLPKCDS